MSRKRDETESIPELREAAETDAQLGVAGEGHRLAPGARLGRYLILYRVGAGGMGEVYAAFDPQLDRKVAVKIARGEAGSETTRLLQRREGQALARLRHPNVVTVHDVGEHAGRLFLAMEFVDGPTLGGWLNEDRPWRRVVELFLQAGRGLAAVHGARLVHQDFKPGNAMVGADGVVRIVDFGLARGQGSSTPAPGAGNGEHSQPRGTPGYLAPERLAGHPSDARSDQYSFCVAIWRALFGRPPLDSGDGAGVPGWLRQALRKGLEAAPEDRFASMEELLAALSPERRSARRRRWAGLAGALTAAALLAGYLALRPAPAPLCTDAADHLRGVWDEPRREAIRSAFVRAGAFGAEAFFALERTLDGYVRGWVAMRTEACEATHLRGEQSQHLLDLRMICLDDRLEGLRALTGALERADREVVVQALPAAMRLRSLSECADRPELVLLNVPELDAEERAEADRIRAAIEEQVALYETGQEDGRSIAVVEELLAELEGLGGYPALESRAAKLLGSLRGEIREDPASVEATYLRALFAAVEAGDRNQQARVLGQLAEEVGYQQQRFEEAERWARLAEATLTALGPGHEETRFNVLHSLGFLAWSAGDYQRAESRYRRALEVGERHWGPESPNLINLLSDLAIALEQAGAKAEGGDERTALLERALRIGEKAYGASNPLLNPILVNLGSNYGIRGRYREALELAGRSLEITEAYYAENRGLGYPLLL
jgi:tetratricopeptide (TPR) repeat protein